MAVFLALLSAAIFGVGDFFGGMAAKRTRVLQVVAGSHLIGAVGALIAATLLAERFDLGDVGLGMAGGAFGVCGVALLYRRLAEGPMGVVAPLTAVASAVVPVAWGVLSGERLSAAGWVGVALGLVAVVLVSLVSTGRDAPLADPGAAEHRPSQPVTPRVVIESLLAGVGFGVLFIFFDATDGASAPWPVAGARVFTASVVVGVLIVVSTQANTPVMPVDRTAWPLIVLVGLFDTGSNGLFLYATDQGQLTVVSILASLYPISTVILARVVLGERMNRYQAAGFVAALSATVLLGLG